jgi:glucose-1-phosphate cytidylyltransferase
MKMYSHYGFNDFIVCCGYRGYMIKDYFHHYYMHATDVTVDLATNDIRYHNSKAEPWKITLVDTGLTTMTGARIRKVQSYLRNERFLLTYGDGVSDVDLRELIAFHERSKVLATLTTIQPSGKFGSLVIGEDARIRSFQEKPRGDNAWINGGFFVLEPGIFQYIPEGEEVIWERGPLESMARDGKLAAYKYQGFWQCMDTLRDKLQLEEMWSRGSAPWKVWDD